MSIIPIRTVTSNVLLVDHPYHFRFVARRLLRDRIPSASNSGIYTINNLRNNRLYVGSSGNILRRWYTHRSNLQKNRHPCAALQSDFQIYSPDDFVFTLLEYENVNYEAKESSLIRSIFASTPDRLYNDIKNASVRPSSPSVLAIEKSRLLLLAQMLEDEAALPTQLYSVTLNEAAEQIRLIIGEK